MHILCAMFGYRSTRRIVYVFGHRLALYFLECHRLTLACLKLIAFIIGYVHTLKLTYSRFQQRPQIVVSVCAIPAAFGFLEYEW